MIYLFGVGGDFFGPYSEAFVAVVLVSQEFEEDSWFRFWGEWCVVSRLS
jgi:hypothetical protein